MKSSMKKGTVRNVVSRRNEYYIPKERTLELTYFCLQYDLWQAKLRDFDYISSSTPKEIDYRKKGVPSDPVFYSVENRARYSRYITIVKISAEATDAELSDYILKGVTQGLSYEQIQRKYRIPCCRQVYYKLRRKFFYILDSMREELK